MIYEHLLKMHLLLTILRLYPCNLGDIVIVKTIESKLELCDDIKKAIIYSDAYTIKERNYCHWGWDNYHIMKNKNGVQMQGIVCYTCGNVYEHEYKSNGLIYCQCAYVNDYHHKQMRRYKYLVDVENTHYNEYRNEYDYCNAV